MNVKSFLFRVLICGVLFVAVDQLAGRLIVFLNSVAGDKYKREEFIRHEMKSEMVLLGSSRCTHHYVPSVFEDSLGLSTFNCGQRGNGIIYEYGRLQTIYERYTPNLIVVDFIEGDFSYCDNRKFLEFLKFDYGTNEAIDSLFYKIDRLSPLKMKIQSFKYNSTLCDLLLNTLLPDRGRFTEQGYYPLYGIFCDEENRVFSSIKQEIELDSIKMFCIHEIASRKKPNSDIVFVLSPLYSEVNSELRSLLQKTAQMYDVPFLDYSNTPGISCNPDMFEDMAHLNHHGALKFSQILAHDLKRMGYVKNKYDR